MAMKILNSMIPKWIMQIKVNRGGLHKILRIYGSTIN